MEDQVGYEPPRTPQDASSASSGCRNGLAFEFGFTGGWPPDLVSSPSNNARRLSLASHDGAWVAALGGVLPGGSLVQLVSAELEGGPPGQDRPTRLGLSIEGEDRLGADVLPRLRTTAVETRVPGDCLLPRDDATLPFDLEVFDADGDPARSVVLEFTNGGENWREATLTEPLANPLEVTEPGAPHRVTWRWEEDGADGDSVRVRARSGGQLPESVARSVQFGARYSPELRLRFRLDADRDGIWDYADDCDQHTDANCDSDAVAFCAGDCDDTNPDQYPGSSGQVCDGLVDDCTGELPDREQDLDSDGLLGCDEGECADDDPERPGNGRETDCLDGVDNDCDGATDIDDTECDASDLGGLGCWLPPESPAACAHAGTPQATPLLLLLLLGVRRRWR